MKSHLARYVLSRIIQFLVVVVVGITIAFVVPRLSLVDPVQVVISQAAAAGVYQNPEAVERLREDLRELYGLKGTLLKQYVGFWKRILRGDFGPSFSSFPTPVMALIKKSLPWTFGLLIGSIVVGWVVGNFLGALAEYYSERLWAKILATITMTVYPIPYYVIALILVFFFCFLLQWFPLVGSYAIGIKPSFSWSFLKSVFKHAFIPGFSIVAVNIGTWFITMKSVVSRIVKEDFVLYAEAIGLSKKRILFQYVVRNAAITQITGLALNLGGIFSGALVAESVFSYPGLGTLLYHAVLFSDLNLMLGIVVFSIIGVSIAALVIDLVYPLIDPRVRYQ